MGYRKKYLIDRVKIWGISAVAAFFFGAVISVICWKYDRFGIIPAALGLTGVLYLYFGYYMIYRPYKNILRLINLFNLEYIKEEFFECDLGISYEIEKAQGILKKMIDQDKKLDISQKQAQYLALQNQINPHFLYNTLEGIRSEALCEGVVVIAEMTEALSTFFRYTISNPDKLVTLEDELENIENFHTIQQFRFGDKISLHIEYGEEDRERIMEILNLRIPKLVLQPVVENAIYHGLEPKLDNGIICIHIEQTEKRLVVRISDNGIGMEEYQVDEINRKFMGISLDEEKQEKKGGVALINVNNRIKLLFGEEYGMYLYSTKGMGTDVELTFPVMTD